MKNFIKNIDLFEVILKTILAVVVIVVVYCSYHVAQLFSFKWQDDVTVSTKNLKFLGSENIGYTTYALYTDTITHDTIAVYASNQVHIHDGWCTDFECNASHIYDGLDSVKALPAKLGLVQIKHTAQYRYAIKITWY